LVESQLILEIKAVEQLLQVHEAQVITYLKLTGLPTGLLVNFHVPVLKSGIRRLIKPPLRSSAPPLLPVFRSASEGLE
jgi:GxxExxY protein